VKENFHYDYCSASSVSHHIIPIDFNKSISVVSRLLMENACCMENLVRVIMKGKSSREKLWRLSSTSWIARPVRMKKDFQMREDWLKIYALYLRRLKRD
jgi:hypothetical protein